MRFRQFLLYIGRGGIFRRMNIDGRFCEKCTENSFKFFASFFFGRFRKTKARIEFWVQNFGKLCIYTVYQNFGPKVKIVS